MSHWSELNLNFQAKCLHGLTVEKEEEERKKTSFSRPAMVKLGTTMELCNAKSCPRERQKIEENALQDSGR